MSSIKVKSIDELIIENSNLEAAIAILVQGCIANNNFKTLQAWDSFRSNDRYLKSKEELYVRT